jgi:metal-sulfur cluster biosynthetic enzyme
MLSNKQITEILKTCYDPEIPVNIVDLGMINKIGINKGKVGISMTLTSPGCPMSGMIMEEIMRKVKKIKGVKDVKVDLLFEPAWTPERMSKSAKVKLGMA